MIFSSQEIEFVNSCDDMYLVFRVYTVNGKKYFRICGNARELLSQIHGKITEFADGLDGLAEIKSVKTEVSPLHESLVFGEEKRHLNNYGCTF